MMDNIKNKLECRIKRKRYPMYHVSFEVKLPADINKKDEYWVSACRPLDIYSQGTTKLEARNNLIEAIKLFLISCYERGVLDQALKECGLSPHHSPLKAFTAKQDNVYIKIPLNLASQGDCFTPCHA
jgi:predicted RNase H-like HicB family nuclease